MKKVFIMLCALWSLSAAAQEQLVCSEYGYTNNADNFHTIQKLPLTSTFLITSKSVTFGNETYTLIDSEEVGLKGLAITYLLVKENKLLYLYTTATGAKEVGISRIETDSDSLFEDKSVFANCGLQQDTARAVEAGGFVKASDVIRF